jgi:AcrR family transcriptional regulator
MVSPRSPAQNERMRSRSREAILRAALELFAERGFGRTTMAEVAARAGVSKGLIYTHVSSKDDLLREIVVERIRQVEEVRAGVGRLGTAGDRLLRFLRASLADVRDHADELRLYVALRLQPESAPGAAVAAAAGAGDRRLLSDQLVTVLRELDSPDPEGDALVAQAALDGIAVWIMIATAAGSEISDAWIEGMVERLSRRLGM